MTGPLLEARRLRVDIGGMTLVEVGAVDALLTAERLSRLYGHTLHEIDDRGRRCFVPK